MLTISSSNVKNSLSPSASSHPPSLPQTRNFLFFNHRFEKKQINHGVQRHDPHLRPRAFDRAFLRSRSLPRVVGLGLGLAPPRLLALRTPPDVPQVKERGKERGKKREGGVRKRKHAPKAHADDEEKKSRTFPSFFSKAFSRKNFCSFLLRRKTRRLASEYFCFIEKKKKRKAVNKIDEQKKISPPFRLFPCFLFLFISFTSRRLCRFF